MGISSLRSAPKAERPTTATLDLSPLGIEGSLTFRAPGVADFFPTVEKRNLARITCPTLAIADPALETQLLLMAACYVPDADEKANPIAEIGYLLNNNLEAFLGLVSLFAGHFPMSLGEAREVAGNGLGQ